MAEKALFLEDLTHDIVMRAKICTTLAERMFRNIQAMEQVSVVIWMGNSVLKNSTIRSSKC